MQSKLPSPPLAIMCLILFAWQSHPDYPLVVAANRDEFYQRPTVPAHFWPDVPDLLAGRDGEQGGSWLGLTRNGRFAAVTNHRGGATSHLGGRSRGALVTDFLRDNCPPATFLQQLEASKAEYNPFNILLGDPQQLCCGSDAADSWLLLQPGVYALGNGRLTDNSAKQQLGREALTEALRRGAALDDLLTLLADQQASLPPGQGDALERALSARFIRIPGYGTRASTALRLSRHGHWEFIEQNFDEQGPLGKPRMFSWDA